jgi:two-component system, sensor histidine kinase and response regulator
MNKPVVYCFSQIKDDLEILLHELHNYFGTNVNYSDFQNSDCLLDSLKMNNSGQESNLFVLDINNSSIETMRFVGNIIQLCPSSIKLIIAENQQLSTIRKFIVNNRSLQFLSKSWTVNELNIALKIASQTYSNLKPAVKKTRQNLSLNEKVEEKVNKRLQKLIDANLAKDSFLSIIAHDLKSPFNALIGISEILMNNWETLTDADKLELIRDIHNSSDDTYKLLESLLEWAKSQKEKMEVNVNEVRIHNVVDNTIKVAENNALVKGIEVENKIDDKLKVNTDENMIATVFRNLITNAVNYTQPGGKIDISAKEDKDFCVFCVADNGSGIDKPHILDIFNKGSKKKINGNIKAFKGLGLILCKDFVEKNGGEIWLETQKGKGSKFYFTVPC